MGDDIPELLRWFEEQYADPSLPGGILKKVVYYGKPIRIQYFINTSSPTSQKPARTHNRASRGRVIRG